MVKNQLNKKGKAKAGTQRTARLVKYSLPGSEKTKRRGGGRLPGGKARKEKILRTEVQKSRKRQKKAAQGLIFRPTRCVPLTKKKRKKTDKGRRAEIKTNPRLLPTARVVHNHHPRKKNIKTRTRAEVCLGSKS